MTDYKKLSKALRTIQDECKKYDECEDCPLSTTTLFTDDPSLYGCAITDKKPEEWEIKPLRVIRLLESE